MDRFQTRAAIAIAAFVVIGAASVVVTAQRSGVPPIASCMDRADREPTNAMGNEITTRRLRSDCTPINPSATVP